MLSLAEIMEWFADPKNWAGRYSLPGLLTEHLFLTVLALFTALILAAPIGIAIGHTRKGEALVVALTSASRAIPTMGLMFALVMLVGIEFREFSFIFALTIIAIPPILAGAYSGVKAIPVHIKESAIAMGMTEKQLIWHVELPLAFSSLIGGLRIAYIQVISTIVLAPLIGLGGLGFGIIQGLAIRNFAQVTGSALIIVVITVVGDQLIGLAQKPKSRQIVEFNKLQNK